MKFYVSTRYSNRAGVERVIRLLAPHGHHVTYDWTKTFGGVPSDIEMGSIAVKEIEGVREADFIIVLLHGGYGTHTEFGAALALNKPIILVAPHDNMLLGPHKNVVPFYHHPLVHRVPDISSIPRLARSMKYPFGAPDEE